VPIPFSSHSGILTRSGKSVWPLYARWENFIGKSPSMVQEWVRINVECQIGNIIKEITCKGSLNVEMISALTKLVGTTFSTDTVAIPVDTLCAGTVNATVELKADTTYLVK
jgi:hypothetical protein